MKYLGAISNAKDLVNKGYVDTIPAIDITQVAHANVMLVTDTDRRQDAALSYDGDQLGGVLTIGNLNTRKGVLNLICEDGNTTAGGAYKASLKATELTANRTLYLPDKGGTIALTTDVVTGVKGNSESSYRKGNVNLTAANIGIADFITEQGTSSSWYYRKWNSGKIEAWTKYDAGSQTPAQWVTGWYYKDITITIPSGIFSATPTHVLATNSGSDYQFSVFAAVPVSTTSIRIRAVKPNSGAANPVFSIYASNMA